MTFTVIGPVRKLRSKSGAVLLRLTTGPPAPPAAPMDSRLAAMVGGEWDPEGKQRGKHRHFLSTFLLMAACLCRGSVLSNNEALSNRGWGWSGLGRSNAGPERWLAAADEDEPEGVRCTHHSASLLPGFVARRNAIETPHRGYFKRHWLIVQGRPHMLLAYVAHLQSLAARAGKPLQRVEAWSCFSLNGNPAQVWPKHTQQRRT